MIKDKLDIIESIVVKYFKKYINSKLSCDILLKSNLGMFLDDIKIIRNF